MKCNRAKRPNKRPPSRKSLHTSASSAGQSGSVSSASSTGPPGLIDRLESEVDKEAGLFSSKRAPDVVKVSLDDDLFGSVKVDSKRPSGSISDDLFSSDPVATPKAKPPKAAKDDLFSAGSPPPPAAVKPKKTPSDSIFDSPPDDVFASGSQKIDTKEDIFAASIKKDDIKSKAEKLDDLFAVKKSPSLKKKQLAKEGTDGTEVKAPGGEEDIFASTEAAAPSPSTAKKAKTGKKKSKAKGGRPDEDLFGNTDDIFGDIPATSTPGKSPKPKKKKKKATTETTDAATEQGGAAKKKVKKKTKKTTGPKDLSMFDENAPSIFDA